MKVRTGMISLAVVFVLLACGNAEAAFNELAIAAKAGTLGLGGDLTTNLIPQVNLRGGVQWLAFSFDSEFGDIEYGVDLDFLNPLVFVDWYPFEGSFRISGGVLFNGSKLQMNARPSHDVEIGDETFTPAEIGELTADVDYRPVAPYIGIGWGNALGDTGRWGLVTDFGVAFTGSPEIDLSATGSMAADPDFRTQLAEEERNIQDKLDTFKIYPILSISLFYRF